MKKGTWQKSTILLVSLLLSLTVVAGGTLAILLTSVDPLVGTFHGSVLAIDVQEELDEEDAIKRKVKIKNTGDVSAYVRAEIVITWQKETEVNGETITSVHSRLPVEGEDYTIVYSDEERWVEGEDGFYYWTMPVPPGETTENLIDECQLTDTPSAPRDYYLSVEIVASAVQSEPINAMTEAWKNVTVNDDGDPSLTIQ